MRQPAAVLALSWLASHALVTFPTHADDFDEYGYVVDDGSERSQRQFWITSQYGSISGSSQAFGPFESGEGIHLLALQLGGQIQLVPTLSLQANLPMVHVRFLEEAETTLGNFTLGLTHALTRSDRSQSFLDTSVSMPSSDAEGMGASAAQGFAAFWAPDPGLYQAGATTFRSIYRHHLGSQMRGLELAVGLHHLFFDMSKDQTRVPISLAGHVNVGGQANLFGRFSNVWLLRGGDAQDDFLHLLEGGLEVGNIGKGEVSLTVYYPLDDTYREALEAWGLGLGFHSAI